MSNYIVIKRQLNIRVFVSAFACSIISLLFAMSFPYKHEHFVKLVLFSMMFMFLQLAERSIHNYGCIQSILATALGILGLVLLNVSLNPDWMFIIFFMSSALSILYVSVNNLYNRYSILLRSVENYIYLLFICFGIVLIYLQYFMIEI